MKLSVMMVVALVLVLATLGGEAQTVPATIDQVARPGGQLPGDPKIALVKVADGFHDPTNVANAGDGSGRIFAWARSVSSFSPSASASLTRTGSV